MKFVITFFFVSVALIATLTKREKLAAGLIVFLIPIGASPFWHPYNITVALSAFLVWAAWIGMRMQNRDGDALIHWSEISKWLVLLYGFLVFGIALAALNTNYSVLDLHGYTPFESIFNFSLYLVALICFIKLFVNFRDDIQFQKTLNYIFIATVFIQLGSTILLQFGFDQYVPSFLVTTVDETSGFARSGGLLGDYELVVDYAMVTCALSVIELMTGGKKTIPLFALFAAVLLALISGTRSFLVTGFIFVFSLLLLNLTFKRMAVTLGIGTIIVAFSDNLVDFISKYLPIDVTFDRLAMAYYYLQMGDYQKAVNRSILESIPGVISTAGILGNGSLTIFKIKDDEMVYHSLYLAVYATFGVIGLAVLFFLLYKLVTISFRICRHAENVILRKEASVFFSLVMALIVNQTKISALRYASSILIYAFVAMNVYYMYYRYSKEAKAR